MQCVAEVDKLISEKNILLRVVEHVKKQKGGEKKHLF